MARKQDTFVPHSHIPYGQDGSGFYSDNNTSCYQVNNAAIPLVVEAVHSTDIQLGSVFTIVDYGTADGGTSMPLMYACVKAIREKYGDELPINIIYEDQPVNDFKSLFMRLQGLIPGPPSYLADFSNVYVMACGTSYYEKCLPSNSVHLGFSGTSMHWLSEKPCDLTDALISNFNSVPEENEKFREQAEMDWERILINRAAELSPGCKMVLVVPVKDDQGQFYTFTNYTKECLLRLLSDFWKEMAKEGFITMEEFKSATFNAYHKTVEEFEKPFKCTDSAVKRAGLELVSIETRVIPCLLRERWMKQERNPKEFAKRLVEAVKAWGYSSFISALLDTRSKEEKTRIVDELYRRYEAEVTKCPEDHGTDDVNAYIVLQKSQAITYKNN